MDSGKKFAEIIEFLNAGIFEHLVRTLMAYSAGTGKPISAETAR
jgi:hypothetical protein